MKIFNKKLDLQQFLAPFYLEKKAVGLVPTMGALHEGHLSLIQKALSENDIVVVSIFVNPTQFNNAEDLEKYPRNLSGDIKTIERLSQEVVIFAPEISEMYESTPKAISFDFRGLDKVMEGKFREGHFQGVATIVEKLFELVKPTRAYFGEKDYQQILIIKSMLEQRKLPVTLVPCPIIREESGLAMSSRNERLSPEGRKQAAFIYSVLQEAQKLFTTASVAEVEAFVKEQFSQKEGFDLEYFTITKADTLEEITEKDPSESYRAFITVYVEGVRLIDNIAL
ncbi:pantoate--beta-alanine ligase [uncultured Capnocytophaga sp.]|uniref:pantoate--beta-alanine ligase n=1 Tax=uncultured Capnocytophaga sp. TaxID=159273 RepID=UPI0026182AF6|nr:pantoate--beta-alanine ligase [uncultured Capnocytophaga sp.]